ncbi:hypothetical protein D3C86_1366510 [compost metagenome]
MGKGAAPVAVAQRPDAVHAGAQLVVHIDIAARISGHAGLVESQVVGVRPAAHGQQHVGAGDLLRAARATRAIHAYRRADALRPAADADAFRFQDLPHLQGDLRIFPRNQVLAALHHRDLRAEPAEHLRELQSHIAAADDDQVPGHLGHRHHVRIRQIGDVCESADFLRCQRAAAHIEKNLVRA